jgi:flagellar basal body-associated protein FliL
MPRAVGPWPQTLYGRPPQPPKKRRTGLIVLLVILAVMPIWLVSCGALIVTASSTEETTWASQSPQAENDKNSTRPLGETR